MDASRGGFRWSGPWWVLGVLLMLPGLLLSSPARAQQPQPVSAASGLFPPPQYLIDPNGTLGPASASSAADWQALPASQRWPGAPGATWFRFQYRAAEAEFGKVVVVPRVFLDEAIIFTRTADNEWRSLRSGDLVPFTTWPRHSLMVELPVTSVPLPPGGVGEVLVRLRHLTPFKDVPQMWTAEAAQRNHSSDHLIIGLFVGVGLVALSYALGEAVSGRDAVSAWYGLHVLLTLIVVCGQLGYVRMYISADDAVVHRGHLLGAGSLLASTTLLFVRRALPPAFGGQMAASWSLGIAMAGVLLAVVYMFWPYVSESYNLWRLRLFFYSAAVAGLFGLLWAARGVRMPHRWWFRVAFVAACIAMTAYSLHAAGAVAGSSLVRYAFPIGGVVEFGLLTYALSLGSKLAADGGAGARRTRVMDRSSGFLHASELPAMLVAMAMRAMRIKQPGSVVLLHLSNLPDLEAEFGAQIGTAAEQAASRTLRLALRPGDEVVRVDRTHYVALLNHVHGHDEARDFAMRVQQLGLQHCPELPPLQQIQWHAAVGHMPRHIQRNPEKLPQRLMQLVNQIRHGSAALVRELP